jgi:hypothetical protein
MQEIIRVPAPVHLPDLCGVFSESHSGILPRARRFFYEGAGSVRYPLMQPKGKFFVLIAVLYARPCGNSISVPVDNYVLLKADDFM